jgi:hypothetical protein
VSRKMRKRKKWGERTSQPILCVRFSKRWGWTHAKARRRKGGIRCESMRLQKSAPLTNSGISRAARGLPNESFAS